MSANDPKRTWKPRLIWRKALARKTAYGPLWGWLVQSSPSPPTPAALAERRSLRPGSLYSGMRPTCPKEDVMNSMRRMFLVLSLLLPVTVLASGVALAETKLDASILSYDGKDFVRTETTMMNEGQSAVGTKLDPASRPTKPWSKKSPTPGQRPLLVKTTKPTTHRSPVQRQIDRCPVRGCAEIVGDPNLSSAAPALFFSLRRSSFISRQINAVSP